MRHVLYFFRCKNNSAPGCRWFQCVNGRDYLLVRFFVEHNNWINKKKAQARLVRYDQTFQKSMMSPVNGGSCFLHPSMFSPYGGGGSGGRSAMRTGYCCARARYPVIAQHGCVAGSIGKGCCPIRPVEIM